MHSMWAHYCKDSTAAAALADKTASRWVKDCLAPLKLGGNNLDITLIFSKVFNMFSHNILFYKIVRYELERWTCPVSGMLLNFKTSMM